MSFIFFLHGPTSIRLVDAESVCKFYEENRTKNHIVRADLNQAKSLQELERMQLVLQLQEKRTSQLNRDAEYAARVQAEELTNDELIERDRQLAQKLQAKEKMRMLRRKLAREKRQVARLSSGQPEASFPSILDDTDADMSDFCMKAPSGLSEEETRIFQEEQDAELARFLQQQEAARNLVKERLQVIEDQDREIARILQEKEKAKLRRLREKNRDRKQRSSSRDASGHHQARDAGQETSPSSASTTCAKFIEANSPVSTLRNTDSTNYEPTCDEAASSPHTSTSQSDEQCDTSLNCNYHNVAIDLDPTYHKRILPQSSCASHDADEGNNVHFARLCRVSPATASETPDLEEDSTVLPVLPGQRRKVKGGKGRRGGDACKNQ